MDKLIERIIKSGLISSLKARCDIRIVIVNGVLYFIKIGEEIELCSLIPMNHQDSSVSEVNYLIVYAFYCAYYDTTVMGENFVKSFVKKICNKYFIEEGYTITHSEQTFEIKNEKLDLDMIIQYVI